MLRRALMMLVALAVTPALEMAFAAEPPGPGIA